MNAPSHESVAQRARELWQEQGRPEGQDSEIWLEAERQLRGAANEVSQIVSASVSTTATAPVEHPVSGTTHDSPVGITHPANLIPGGSAAQVTNQKKSARAPKRPSKTAPNVVPAETGKPLWDKPHSS